MPVSTLRVGVRAAVLALAVTTAFAVQAPASAHHKPGHSGGPGGSCPNPQDKYPPGQCNRERASVDDNTLVRGQAFHYRAQGFLPNSSAALAMFSTPIPLGTATADEFTFFDVVLKIPSNAQLGSHRIVSTGQGADGQPLTLSVPVVVTAGATQTTVGDTDPGTTDDATSVVDRIGLPRTGMQVLVAAATGAFLVLVGGVLLLSVRRRRLTI